MSSTGYVYVAKVSDKHYRLSREANRPDNHFHLALARFPPTRRPAASMSRSDRGSWSRPSRPSSSPNLGTSLILPSLTTRLDAACPCMLASLSALVTLLLLPRSLGTKENPGLTGDSPIENPPGAPGESGWEYGGND